MTKWLRKPGLSWGLFFLLAGAGGGFAQDSADPLEVHFIDVGQADAILVWCPDGEHALLIDSGEVPGNFRYPGSSDAFRAYLEAEFEGKPRRIDVAVASHPHSDHIGNMLWVLENFDIETYVDNGDTNVETVVYGNLQKKRIRQTRSRDLTYINGKKVPFAELDFCPRPDVTAQILVPWAVRSLPNTNDRSVLVWLEHGNNRFLFTGDAHERAEEVLLDDLPEDQQDKLDVHVLKVGHHGSDTSSSAEFVQAVSPDVVVVSTGEKGVGTNKRHKHPRYSTLRAIADWFKNLSPDEHPLERKIWAYDARKKRWRQHTRRVGLWVTPKDGTVIVCSDGTSVTPNCHSTNN